MDGVEIQLTVKATRNGLLYGNAVDLTYEQGMAAVRAALGEDGVAIIRQMIETIPADQS